MKKAKINIETEEIDGKFYADFHIESLGGESFQLGNSSFVIEYEKDSLLNPEMTYRSMFFSDSDLYEELELKEIYKGWTSMIQFRLKPDGFGTEGYFVYDTLLCSITFDRGTTKDINFRWRLRDTAIVTPDFQTIETQFFINDILNMTVQGQEGNTMDIDLEQIKNQLSTIDSIVMRADTDLKSIKNSIEEVNDDILNIVSLTDAIREEINSGGGVDPVITFDAPVRHPANDGVMLASQNTNHVLFSAYTGLEFKSPTEVLMRYHWGLFALTCKSATGLPATWLGKNVVNPSGDVGHYYAPITTAKFKGKYYQAPTGLPSAGFAPRYITTSLDGINNWSAMTKIGDYGEDWSFCIVKKNGQDWKLRLYGRPEYPSATKPRRVVMIESEDGVNWSNPIDIFTPEDMTVQDYSFTVCQVAENMFYGIKNTYNTYTDVVYMEYYKSTDGITWEYIQYISRPGSFKQQFGAVSFNPFTKEVWILVEESEGFHNNSNGKFFRLALYTVKVRGI